MCQRIEVGARIGATTFFHTGIAPEWCGSGAGSGSGLYTLAYIGIKSKTWYQFPIFYTILYVSKDRGRSQNRSHNIFPYWNRTRMMRLRCWLQFRPLYIGHTVIKSKNLISMSDFLHYAGQRIEDGARTGATLFFHPGTAPKWCGSCAGSGSGLCTLANIVINQKLDINFWFFTVGTV
jgi:hypothetical protein